MNPSLIGQTPPRDDGLEKVSGKALYVDDLDVPGMLHGITVRSPVASARVLAVDWDEGFDWSGIVRVTARDIPHENILPLIARDQRILVRRYVRHMHEPMALLACADPQRLKEAVRHVHLRYESRPMVSQIEDALEAEIKVSGEDNVFKDITIRRGDAAAALEKSPVVLEESFTTGHQEHLYLEPQGMLAHWKDGVLHLRGSMQCPYYVHEAMKAVFHLEDSEVSVVQATTGGGFGGKEEYPSLLAAHCALLARAAGRPVKMVYDRAEDMSSTTKRHPSEITIKAGVDQQGHLAGVDIDVLLDGGAYCTLSPVVLSRAVLHALSAYRCEHVHIRGRVVATNTPPNGAFRGFGAPQVLFAMERMMDQIAEVLDMSPLEVRRRNALVKGDSTATGQCLKEEVSALDVLRRAAEAADFDNRWRRFREAQGVGVRRGIGVSLVMHGCGFTGSGEKELASAVEVGIRLVDGQPRAWVATASTDMGQGMRTTFRQIAAASLGLSYEAVEILPADTARVPNSGPTVASRTCMVVGGLVARAARDCLDALGSHAEEDSHIFTQKLLAAGGRVSAVSRWQQPADLVWDEETCTGAAYPTYGFACTICEVEVDPVTCETRIVNVVTCQDVGRAIHPAIVEGQIEGGLVQALGFAGYERVVMRDGSMRNHDVSNYVIPTAVDIPPIRVLLHEEPFAGGPFGARGIGEMPMDGGAPAYVAAVSQAVGMAFRDVPLLAEQVLRALTRGKSGGSGRP